MSISQRPRLPRQCCPPATTSCWPAARAYAAARAGSRRVSHGMPGSRGTYSHLAYGLPAFVSSVPVAVRRLSNPDLPKITITFAGIAYYFIIHIAAVFMILRCLHVLAVTQYTSSCCSMPGGTLRTSLPVHADAMIFKMDNI